MRFNNHTNLEGLHAPFGASKSSWLRYDDDKAIETYQNMKAAELGTRLHAWAAETIKLGIKQPRSNKTISAYVNDAIGFKMSTEVVLFYSEYFFGTADAICFRNNTLRIHDLKTGSTKVKMEQLEIYAALFCLEYKIKPADIEIELRIYQNDEILVHKPEVDDIVPIMDKIVHLNRLITNMEGGV
ncbi:MAG: DUF2800 domain-containing protein [Clostridia bacterium]|nr:DUF2800 domain-containing protein [Clostridia bacterium]